MNNFSQFGLAIKEERICKNIPLWKFASSIPFPQSNIQKIEKGQTEPRIGLAMRMLEVLELDAGVFFQRISPASPHIQTLAKSCCSAEKLSVLPVAISAITAFALPSGHKKTIPSFPSIPPGMERSRIFGIFFRHVRLLNSQTQADVAAFSDYTPRSLIAVENGHQEPAVGTALKLVKALDCDLKWFFNELQQQYIDKGR